MAKTTRKFALASTKQPEPAKEPETPVVENSEAFDPDDVKEARQTYLDTTGKELKLSDAAIAEVIEAYGDQELSPEKWVELFDAEMAGETEVSRDTASQIRLDAMNMADAMSKNEYLVHMAESLLDKGEDVRMGPLDMYYVILAMHEKGEIDMDTMPVPNTTAKTSNRPDRYKVTVEGSQISSSYYEDLAGRFPKGKAILDDKAEVKKGEEGRFKDELRGKVKVRKKSLEKKYNSRWNAWVGLFKTAMRIHYAFEGIRNLPHCDAIVDTETVGGRVRPIRSPANIVVKDTRREKSLNFDVISWTQLLRYDPKKALDEGDGGFEALDKTKTREPRKPDAKDVNITRDNYLGLASNFYRFMSDDDNWKYLRQAIQPGKVGSDEMLTTLWHFKVQLQGLTDDQAPRFKELDAKVNKASGNEDKKAAA